jgi:cupin fold WbuC family metalloprotein
MSIKVFSPEFLDDLILQAAVSPRRRQHRNIHSDYADPCQRFFNAIEPDSYLRPHRHGPTQGAETLIAVRGVMALVAFDDQGEIKQIQRLGGGAGAINPNVAIGTEIPPGQWHTVVSLASGSVLLEVKAGPFDPNDPKVPAPWAPEEGTPDGVVYLKRLITAITSNA